MKTLLPLCVILLVCSNNEEKPVASLLSKIIETEVEEGSRWGNLYGRDSLLSIPNLHPSIKKEIADTLFLYDWGSVCRFLEGDIIYRPIGDINHDGKLDSVMLFPELWYSEEDGWVDGLSILFSDVNIPKVRSTVSCVQLDNIYPVIDIDKDGIDELMIYRSSCASRYKRIELLSIYKGQWNIFGQATYDVGCPDPPIDERFQYVGDRFFRMREIYDCWTHSGPLDKWKTFHLAK